MINRSFLSYNMIASILFTVLLVQQSAMVFLLSLYRLVRIACGLNLYEQHLDGVTALLVIRVSPVANRGLF